MFGKVLKFNLTDRWRKRVLRMIAENDLLEVTIKRTGRNQFKIYAGVEGEKIFEMQAFKLDVGDELCMRDFKTSFDMEE